MNKQEEYEDIEKKFKAMNTTQVIAANRILKLFDRRGFTKEEGREVLRYIMALSLYTEKYQEN